MSRGYIIEVVVFGVCAFFAVFMFVGLSRGSARVAVLGGTVGAIIMMSVDLLTHLHPHAR
jgi:phosphotransferase system  glucose/maltose/N-acetylglucosamine-specific IIC component